MTGLRSAGRVRQRASSPCETAAHLELKELLNDLASIRSRYDTLVTEHGHLDSLISSCLRIPESRYAR